jgi:CubicO group peptidase (beta-lactamase class C family)
MTNKRFIPSNDRAFLAAALGAFMFGASLCRSWGHDPQGISNGGQGSYLQPRDMAKIGYLYLRYGACESKQLLPSDWIDKVTHATIDPHAPGEPELRYSNLF